MREVQRKGRDLRVPSIEDCEEVDCLNCGTRYRGRHCPLCGQPAVVKRLSTRGLFPNLLVSVLGGDNAFFNTCLNLCYRPGYMVRDYICGSRARYFQPIRMLVCLVAVFALVSFVFDSNYAPFRLSEDPSVLANVHSATLQKAIHLLQGLLSNNVAYSLFSAFVFVLPFRVMYRRRKVGRPDGVAHSLNTAEHFYVMVYVSCQAMLLSFLMFPFHHAAKFEAYSLLIDLFATILLPAWSYRQIYEIGWLRSVAVSLTAFAVTIVALICFLLLAFGLFYGYESVVAT